MLEGIFERKSGRVKQVFQQRQIKGLKDRDLYRLTEWQGDKRDRRTEKEEKYTNRERECQKER